MAWSTMIDFAPEDVYTAAADDAQRGNIEWLGNWGIRTEVVDAVDRGSTSSSFVDVSSSVLTITKVCYGNPVMIYLWGYGLRGNSGEMDFTLDGTRLGNVTHGLGVSAQYLLWHLLVPAAGSHIFRVQWRHVSGWQIYLDGASWSPTRFGVWGG